MKSTISIESTWKLAVFYHVVILLVAVFAIIVVYTLQGFIRLTKKEPIWKPIHAGQVGEYRVAILHPFQHHDLEGNFPQLARAPTIPSMFFSTPGLRHTKCKHAQQCTS